MCFLSKMFKGDLRFSDALRCALPEFDVFDLLNTEAYKNGHRRQRWSFWGCFPKIAQYATFDELHYVRAVPERVTWVTRTESCSDIGRYNPLNKHDYASHIAYAVFTNQRFL